MRAIRRLRRYTLVILAALGICGEGNREVVDLSAHFQKAGYVGSFALYDAQKDRTFLYNSDRNERPLPPASTFKVFNSLVGLESGVIADENHVFRWDGKQHPYASWNRDHTLESAIKSSVVWYYQELARRVGPERMQSYLDRVDYGNGDISAGVDLFWLEGPFRVTALEQIELLIKLHAGDLPFSRRNQDIVKKIMIVEETSNYVLRAKTGLAFRHEPKIGWWIGYIEMKKTDDVYFFATNIDARRSRVDPEFLQARKDITRAALRHFGVLIGSRNPDAGARYGTLD